MKRSEFREKMAALPEVNKEDRSPWATHRRMLRRHVGRDEPFEFLNWSTVKGTMFTGESGATQAELEEIKMDKAWPRTLEGIRENPFGLPKRMSNAKFTSGNMVRHAFYLRRLEKWTGVAVERMDRIIEFGGGYGLMCKLVSNIGFKGEYTLYDFPELLLLQDFYLSNVGVKCSVKYREAGNYPDLQKEHDLLIALCSLSEVMDKARELFLVRTSADHYLIAFQQRWEEVNNFDYFKRFANPGRWRLTRHPYEQTHWCLVGGFEFRRRFDG